MTLQIKPSELEQVRQILRQYVPNAEYRVFGSRFYGTAQRYSDLDLAVVQGEPIPLATLAAMEEAFAESDLPFKVDIIDWQRVSPDFQQKIEQGFEEI